MVLGFSLHPGWNPVKIAELFSFHAAGMAETGFLLRPNRSIEVTWYIRQWGASLQKTD